MKPLLSLLALIVASLTCPARAAEITVPAGQSDPGIAALTKTFLNSMNRKDWDTCRQMFSKAYLENKDNCVDAFNTFTAKDSTSTFDLLKLELSEVQPQRAKGTAYIHLGHGTPVTRADGSQGTENFQEFFEASFEAAREAGDPLWQFTAWKHRPSDRGRDIYLAGFEKECEQQLAKPDLTDRNRALYISNLAGTYLTSRAYAKAEETCRKALKYGRTIQQVHVYLAHALEAQGKYDEAIQQYELTKQFPKDLMFAADADRQIKICRMLKEKKPSGQQGK